MERVGKRPEPEQTEVVVELVQVPSCVDSAHVSPVFLSTILSQAVIKDDFEAGSCKRGSIESLLSLCDSACFVLVEVQKQVL